MSLIDELNEEIRSNKEDFGDENETIMVSTGFKTFDYTNGMKLPDKNGKEVIHVGIDSGKLVTIIGKSGSGKTTLALQMATNIIRRYENSSMFVFDFEQSTTEERIKMVSGMTDEEYRNKVTLKQVGISTETVMRMVKKIEKWKLENKNKLLVDNLENERDADGNLIKFLPPTVLVVDSIATMMPQSISEEEEMKGQMSATAIAKANTQLFKRIAMPCANANIVVLFVNHINQKIETSVVPTQSQTMYLSQSETLPGGNACIYLTNTLIRVTTANKLEPDKLYGIKGFICHVALVKSRTAPSGSSIDMVFNQREGFDDDLSLLEFIKANNKLLGAGVSYKLQGLETHTFRLSNFKEKLSSDPELREHFYKLGTELLSNAISTSEKLKVQQQEETVSDTEAIPDEVLNGVSDEE